MKKRTDYIPAFHFHWLTRWYDPAIRCFFPESSLKTAIITQAKIQPNQQVLDIGCGTGTLTLLIKQTQPKATVYGLDIDRPVLNIARRKAEQAAMPMILQQGTATCLPYSDASFDHVSASLLLHHLKKQDKQHAIREAFRVLKPGGHLYVADFCKPHGTIMWFISLAVRWAEETHDNIAGLLPVFMAEAGFDPVEEAINYRTIFGSVALYRASKPKI